MDIHVATCGCLGYLQKVIVDLEGLNGDDVVLDLEAESREHLCGIFGEVY